ncbi:MAG: putative metal-binding motif-containing protein [Nanoarchaeota archaeon]
MKKMSIILFSVVFISLLSLSVFSVECTMTKGCGSSDNFMSIRKTLLGGADCVIRMPSGYVVKLNQVKYEYYDRTGSPMRNVDGSLKIDIQSYSLGVPCSNPEPSHGVAPEPTSDEIKESLAQSCIVAGITDWCIHGPSDQCIPTIPICECANGAAKLTIFKDSDGDFFCEGENMPYTYDWCPEPGVWPPVAPRGYRLQACVGVDCNDRNAAINPSETEICDDIDNDCDGEVDEGVKIEVYKDSDGDGYCAESEPGKYITQKICIDDWLEGYTTSCLGADCDADTNPAIYPNTQEVYESNCYDGKDNDCDGKIDCEDGNCAAKLCNQTDEKYCFEGNCVSSVCCFNPTTDECVSMGLQACIATDGYLLDMPASGNCADNPRCQDVCCYWYDLSAGYAGGCQQVTLENCYLHGYSTDFSIPASGNCGENWICDRTHGCCEWGDSASPLYAETTNDGCLGSNNEITGSIFYEGMKCITVKLNQARERAAEINERYSNTNDYNSNEQPVSAEDNTLISSVRSLTDGEPHSMEDVTLPGQEGTVSITVEEANLGSSTYNRVYISSIFFS